MFKAFIVLLCAGCSLTVSSQIPQVSTYNDGLPRSTPEEQGVPSQIIADFMQQVKEKGYDVHTLMMIRHGKVIFEHSWAPYAPQYQHAMYSATKTFTGMAVGFAVQEGLLKIDDKVTSFFPDLLPDTISPQLAKLTVKHLLTMSVGHASTSYVGSGRSQVKSFLAARFSAEPGTRFAYNITASHMLSHILTKLTGMTLHEYLKPRLLDPLGIKDVIWEMDNDGVNMGNGGTHMRISDMAKMGLFLIQKGKWNGKQLLPVAWMEAATTPHIQQKPERTAAENEQAADDASQGYGYQIWMGRKHSYRAIGGQNQLVMVIPDQDFILVCQSSISDEAGFNSLIYDMLPSMSATPLKKDPSFNWVADPKTTPLGKWSVLEAKVSLNTRRFEMTENTLGIKNVFFRFDAHGNCHLTFVTAGAVHNIPFGLDNWLYGSTDRTLSMSRSAYPNQMGVTPVQTAGWCAWTAENKLSAQYLSLFNPGSTETFSFTFEGNQLHMEIVAPTGRRPGPPGAATATPSNMVLTGTLMK